MTKKVNSGRRLQVIPDCVEDVYKLGARKHRRSTKHQQISLHVSKLLHLPSLNWYDRRLGLFEYFIF